jgi:uncharacterized protein YbbK (DUF523 family)
MLANRQALKGLTICPMVIGLGVQRPLAHIANGKDDRELDDCPALSVSDMCRNAHILSLTVAFSLAYDARQPRI